MAGKVLNLKVGRPFARVLAFAVPNPRPEDTIAADLFEKESAARSPNLIAQIAHPASVGWVERKRNPSPLADRADQVAGITRPIPGITTEPDPAVERRKRPILRPNRMAMLDRVEVDVIAVPDKIVLAAQCMLSIAPLPDPALAFRGAAGRDRLTRRQGVCEGRFDQPPSRGEIGIRLRQRPDHMQMVGQDHGGFDRERMARSYRAERRPQQPDVLGQQRQPTVGEIDREETARAGEEVAAIVRQRADRIDGDGFRCAQPILHLLLHLLHLLRRGSDAEPNDGYPRAP
jgi:hypothetical protein